MSLRMAGGLLSRYLRPQAGRASLLAVLVLGSIALQVLAPQIVRWFIDAVASDASTERLTWLGVLFLIAGFAQQVLRIGATYVGEVVGWTASNRLRSDVMTHCLGLDLSFHKSHPPGQLIERIDGDVTAMANFFSQFVIQILGNLILLIGVVVVLWVEDWRVGLPIALFAAVSLGGIAQSRTFAVRYYREARQASAELYGFIEERLGGLPDIWTSGASAYVMRRLFEHTRQRVLKASRARVMGSLPWIVPAVSRMSGQALVLVIASFLYQERAITVGAAFVFVYYVRLLFQPIEAITTQMEEFQRAAAGIVRVADLMMIRSALPDSGVVRLPEGPLRARFDNVTFGYGEAEAALHGVSFNLPPGERLGLLGRTGSGKSTIARLLLRLYDPASGAVRFSGMVPDPGDPTDVDARSVALVEVRRRVGTVTQDVQLFQATLRENLRLFDAAIGDEQLLAALAGLGLEKWLSSLPSGLDTLLGAAGTGLSAGEAQLVAFTRVFLRDPGLVILDEASSRLDPATERLIEQVIDRMLVGRTAVIIAHRLATVARVDRILVLEDGRVVEDGRRADLAADADSRFSALLRIAERAVLA